MKEILISNKFEPTEFIVSTIPTGKTYIIGKDRSQLVATKAEGGLFDWLYFRDIEGWFPKLRFDDTESVVGKVQQFKKDIRYRNIIREGKNLGIYQLYDLGTALLLANQLVIAGALETVGDRIMINLKERNRRTRCRLDIIRHKTDEPGVSKVGIGIFRIYHNDWYFKSNGVLFGN